MQSVKTWLILHVVGACEKLTGQSFLHGDNHQWKVTSETTTLVWVWPVVPFVQSDSRIL